MKIIQLYTSSGKHAGCTVQNDVLYRTARSSKHLLRKPPAWAFERHILEKARRMGATQVLVEDADTKTVYTAPLSAFDLYGITIQRGYGEQVALPLLRWQVHRNAQGQLTLDV